MAHHLAIMHHLTMTRHDGSSCHRSARDAVLLEDLSSVGSYLRLIDSCITQRKALGPSRTCNESKEEEEEEEVSSVPAAYFVS